MKQILKDIGLREREVWREEARARSKLVMIERLIEHECKAQCVEVGCKRQRSMLAKLRGETAELKIETGRLAWFEKRREDLQEL